MPESEDMRKQLDTDAALYEELAEVLSAISVIAKTLAQKITANQMSKEDKDVQALRTDGRDRQSKT